MAESKVLHLDDSTFDDAAADGVVLLDLWAPWCAPCRMMGPILEELAGDLDGIAKVAKVNVEDSPALAARFAVQAIPLIVVLKDGQELGRLVGVQPKHTLSQAVGAALEAGDVVRPL